MNAMSRIIHHRRHSPAKKLPQYIRDVNCGWCFCQETKEDTCCSPGIQGRDRERERGRERERTFINDGGISKVRSTIK